MTSSPARQAGTANVLSPRELADLRVRRWAVRAIGYAVLVVASSAWLVRNDVPFLPAFLIQVLAATVFVALILGSIAIGMAVGAWVGKLNAVLGWIVGLSVGGAFFMFAGMGSTEIPIIGPAIDRIVSLIE